MVLPGVKSRESAGFRSICTTSRLRCRRAVCAPPCDVVSPSGGLPNHEEGIAACGSGLSDARGRSEACGGFSGVSLSHVFEDDGITLDATLTLRSASAHLDWFPFGGGFHLSPGVMLYNGNQMNAVAPASRLATWT